MANSTQLLQNFNVRIKIGLILAPRHYAEKIKGVFASFFRLNM